MSSTPPCLGRLTLLCSLTLSATVLHAQEHIGTLSPTPGPGTVVHPGDAAVDGARLVPYTNAWQVTYQDSTGRVIARGGRWLDTVTVFRQDGRTVLRRAQTVVVRDGKVFQTTVNLADAASLRPIMSAEYRGPAGWRREFDGTHVTIAEDDSSGGHRTHQAVLGTESFDFYGGLMGLLIAAFPLREGYQATFPADFEAQDGERVEWVSFRVAGRDTVAAGEGRTVPAWVVDLPTPYGPYRFWLSDRAPYIIRLVYTRPNGLRQIWDMV
jgi:hypothetical protein